MGGPNSFVVLGIGKRNALLSLLKEALSEHGLALIGCDASAYPPARVVADRFFQVPKAFEKDYVSRVLEVLGETKAMGFMTLIDPEIPVLGQVNLSAVAKFVQPIAATAALCEDKFALVQWLETAGVSVIPTSLRPLESYPFIVKDRLGSCASGFGVIAGDKDLNDFVVKQKGADYVFQPFVDGEHYCIDAYYSVDDGCLVDCCAKEILSKDKGESYVLKSVDRAEFVPMLDLIGAHLKLNGIVNLDVYRYEGKLALMEINCRVGGNYPASHALGCNLLKPLINDMLGYAPSKRHSFSMYEVGAVVAKYFEFTAPQR